MKKSFKLININRWDINILLKWRNEINTRRNSISSKKIKFIQHKHWFTKRLKQKPLFFWKLKFNNDIIKFNPGENFNFNGRKISMQRCLNNLVENAAKFANKIEVTFKKLKSNILITIEDD